MRKTNDTEPGNDTYMVMYGESWTTARFIDSPDPIAALAYAKEQMTIKEISDTKRVRIVNVSRLPGIRLDLWKDV